MDPSKKEKSQKIKFNHPYFVHLQINNQESFCVRNLSLSDYLRLLHDDEYTVNYVRALITSGVIKNTDGQWIKGQCKF